MNKEIKYENKKKIKKEATPHVPGKSPSPVLMWPATA